MTAFAPCPLCDDLDALPVGSIPYTSIWAGLRDEWGATFDEEIVRAHQPAPDAELVRCGTCGLEHFEPLAPGDARFYERLMAAMPYNADRWEFGRVLPSIPPGGAVVDLGSGDGAFLARASAVAGRAAGVDHNADAVAELRRRGVEAHAVDFPTFARAEPNAFDVAVSFHTLEHLASVAPLMEAAKTCVRPGGAIFLSVPNRQRAGRRDDEPLDCPPHHVSRWDADQLRFLADRFGLELAAIRFEQLDLSHARLIERERARPWLDRLGARDDRAFLTRVWTHVAVGPTRHERAVARERYSARGRYGHAMLAELRVPGDEDV